MARPRQRASTRRAAGVPSNWSATRRRGAGRDVQFKIAAPLRLPDRLARGGLVCAAGRVLAGLRGVAALPATAPLALLPAGRPRRRVPAVPATVWRRPAEVVAAIARLARGGGAVLLGRRPRAVAAQKLLPSEAEAALAVGLLLVHHERGRAAVRRHAVRAHPTTHPRLKPALGPARPALLACSSCDLAVRGSAEPRTAERGARHEVSGWRGQGTRQWRRRGRVRPARLTLHPGSR